MSADTPTIWPLSSGFLGRRIPRAAERQRAIPGFDQGSYSSSHALCIGAGGLISHVAPALARKGIGRLTILDADDVEASNLNRQRFYVEDIGRNKAQTLAAHLQRECIHETAIIGVGVSLQTAMDLRRDLRCDVAVCGVDNNPTRTCASLLFRSLQIPVVFTGVSRDADSGYVFVQDTDGACFGCVFPDAITDERYPCPGTPAMLDILQAVGALAVYAVDTCVTARPSDWNYRSISLSTGSSAASRLEPSRPGCPLCQWGA